MKEQLQSMKIKAIDEINSSMDLKSLDEIRVAYLGKKGELTKISKGMKDLTTEERPVVGKLVNEVRTEIETTLANKLEELKLKKKMMKLESEKIDVTMPSKKVIVGKKHPITKVYDRIKDIFMGLGFCVASGPEIDTVFNNFDALNAPKNHPSRDKSDTFYINDNLVLRTQTSTVQIRTMMNEKPPIKIIAPGRCFRFDEVDATHSPMFHQIEGLVVGENVTMSELKGTLELFAKEFFGENTKTKFRPHNFPFTEPSVEVDVTCFKCNGEGCSMCKGEGFIEILGAGMVHPNVLRNCGIDPEKYSGFAFGMGVDRITMLKYEIDDIRLLFENDMRFLNQF
ncbi:MAG: phenylalanine--tRNA ligase subunit alpha [Peptostreptococcaceae bacterium]|jgi:phenylalanyl-tRNA synthetase alpha chain|nr:phenylalanine--tRNA ligase subunit alpha [Peptostreptococcaceae bacterium]